MTLKILGLSGSLRAGSVNGALLRAAAELAPKGVEVLPYDYRDVPLYDGDLAEVPAGVERLKAAIGAADGLLISTPEYNYSVPGVLKNAIDWASRPAYASVLRTTPTAILSASPGASGGNRAQQHLRNVLAGTVTPVFPWPEFMVGGAFQKVQDGVLVDEKTRAMLGELVAAFAAWIEKVR